MLHVLRLRPGARVVLIDGRGWEAHAVLVRVDAGSAVLEISEVLEEHNSRMNVRVIISLLKKSPMDWMVEKLTEIGVSRLSPVIMNRTVVRPGVEKLDRHRRRWQTISLQSLKQCRRSVAMQIDPVVQVSQVMEECKGENGSATKKIMLWEGEASQGLLELLLSYSKDSGEFDVSLLIGPEGGITQEELEDFKTAGFVPVTVGPYILKSETAAIVAAGLVRSVMFSAGP